MEFASWPLARLLPVILSRSHAEIRLCLLENCRDADLWQRMYGSKETQSIEKTALEE